MTFSPARCLILACGNTLRGDDAVGPWLAAWAHKRFLMNAGVRVLARQQWTPELAEEIARAESVLFIDCSTESTPGLVKLMPVEPATGDSALATHHLEAPQLLTLGRALYDSLPRHAVLLTVGAGSLGLREGFTDVVKAALPTATKMLETTVENWLETPQPS